MIPQNETCLKLAICGSLRAYNIRLAQSLQYADYSELAIRGSLRTYNIRLAKSLQYAAYSELAGFGRLALEVGETTA